MTRDEAAAAAQRARAAHSLYEDLGDHLTCLCGTTVADADAYVNHVFEVVIDEILTLQAAPSDRCYALLDDRADRPAQERLIGVFATCSMAMAKAAVMSRRLSGWVDPLAWTHDDPPTHLSIPTQRPFGRRWRVQVLPGRLSALHWSIREQPLLGQEPATLALRAGTVTQPGQKGDGIH